MKQKLKRDEALGQSVAKMPDEATTARPDRHERTDGVKRGGEPSVSFDLCYTSSETKSA